MATKSYHNIPAQYKTSGFTRAMRNAQQWEGRKLPHNLNWTAFHWTHSFCDGCGKFHRFDDLHNPIYPTTEYAWWMQSQLGIEEAQGFCDDCEQALISKAESIDADWKRKSVDGGLTPADETPLVNIVSRHGYDFAIEFFNDFYNLVTAIGSGLPAKTAAKTTAAINAAIAALIEDMQPEPPTPAAPVALRIVEQVATYAVSNSTGQNIVNISKPVKLTKAQHRVLQTMADGGYHLTLRGNSYRFCKDGWVNWNGGTVLYATGIKLHQLGLIEDGEMRVQGTIDYTWQISDAGRAAIATPAAKVSPADAGVRENVIRVPQKPVSLVGAYYPATFALADLCANFNDQYHVLPTRIAFHDNDDAYRFDSYGGIAVVKSRSVPSGQIHLSFDPAKAVAA